MKTETKKIGPALTASGKSKSVPSTPAKPPAASPILPANSTGATDSPAATGSWSQILAELLATDDGDINAFNVRDKPVPGRKGTGAADRPAATSGRSPSLAELLGLDADPASPPSPTVVKPGAVKRTGAAEVPGRCGVSTFAGLFQELEDGNAARGDLRRIDEVLRAECHLLGPEDRLMECRKTSTRMFVVSLRESHSAMHTNCTLHLSVIGLDLGGRPVWQTVFWLPLPAPDCQGGVRAAGEVMDAVVNPAIDWLVRYHSLARAGHERLLAATSTKPPCGNQRLNPKM